MSVVVIRAFSQKVGAGGTGIVVSLKIAIWRSEMTTNTVSVSEFKLHCLDVIRRVEQEGTAVDLTRRGKVVARLVPTAATSLGTPMWLRLRGQGQLLAQPEESVLDAKDFAAAHGPVA
jgi:antitoxin (DNA-binding transcriptional repressor) of toxin-antitoxin stability system